MKLSIIIPVFNVEQYVKKCLLSVTTQDISRDNCEIIVVNDGSTDNSLALAEQIAADQNNMTVVSQENRGLSAARNRGLSLAKGDYVWFVDSDDWIGEDCLRKIIPLLNENIDCLTFKYNEYIDTARNRVMGLPFKGCQSGIELMRMYKISTPVPFTIFRKSLFSNHNLSFHEGIYHEDSELVPKLYYYAQTSVFLDEVCYYYFQREGSIMSSFSLKKALDILLVNENLISFAGNMIENKSERSIFYYRIGLNVNTLLSRLNQLSENEWKQISSILLKKRDMFVTMIRSRKIKYKWEGLSFLLAPKATLLFYRNYLSK
ncbi:MAG: glycosyltransferase [Bacteroidales bacterium]|jgi:glycosyltransferase involved in cell wall biosynthesis|nr:glycosyltransferase [Bacteroidales bacterium]